MRIRAIALLILTALSLVSCTQPATSGGKPRKVSVRSVVSLSPNVTELLSLFTTSILTGRTKSCNFPLNLDAPVVCDVKPDYEQIAGIHPQVIVYDASLFSDADISKLKTISNCDVMPMDVHSVDDLEKFLKEFGKKLGCETSFSEYMDKIRVGLINNKNPSITKKPHVIVLMGSASESYYAAGKNTFIADVLRKCNADYIGPEAPNFVPINTEELVASQPDLIITSSHKEEILKDARLANTPAVKNGLVYQANGDVLLRIGSRINQLVDVLGPVIETAGNQ